MDGQRPPLLMEGDGGAPAGASGDAPRAALPHLSVRRLRRTGSPRTMGARAVDLYVLVDPQAPDDFLPLVGAAEGPHGDGPPSFRQPGALTLHLGDGLVMLKVV